MDQLNKAWDIIQNGGVNGSKAETAEALKQCFRKIHAIRSYEYNSYRGKNDFSTNFIKNVISYQNPKKNNTNKEPTPKRDTVMVFFDKFNTMTKYGEETEKVKKFENAFKVVSNLGVESEEKIKKRPD